MIEWGQVKDPAAAPEPLGCWRTVDRGGGEDALRQSGVEPDYWRVPGWVGRPTFESLVKLVEGRAEGVARERRRLEAAGEDVAGKEPEEQLVCFDQLLRTWEETRVDGTPIEKEALQDLDPLGPTWHLIGQHLHWNARTASLALALRTRLLGSPSQPYIAVHLRQGDFIAQRRTQAGLVAPFVEGVAAVQARLVAKRGEGWAGLPVVFATDSEDEEYLGRLKGLGWRYLDQGEVGGWWPAHLDLAVLSGASGFVG